MSRLGSAGLFALLKDALHSSGNCFNCGAGAMRLILFQHEKIAKYPCAYAPRSLTRGRASVSSSFGHLTDLRSGSKQHQQQPCHFVFVNKNCGHAEMAPQKQGWRPNNGSFHKQVQASQKRGRRPHLKKCKNIVEFSKGT